MRDGSDVELTVLTAQGQEAEAIFDMAPSESRSADGLTHYVFDTVSYGDLSFLQKLINAGIAFNSYWGKGNTYDAGKEVCRFTSEGVLDHREIYDADYNPDLDLLMQHINEPDKLKEIIAAHHKTVIPLPWDNQEEYGKLYRARQLITPECSPDY